MAAITKRRTGKLILCIAVFTAVFIFGAATRWPVRAQSAESNWQTAAGGHMEFDVASVRQNTQGYPPTGPPPHSDFPLDSGDAYSANGGFFSATNWPLDSYIGFAYKLSPTALGSVRKQMPKWGSSDHFDIQARAQGNPTKDQIRLMVQSLLADRFKLVVHHDSKQMPVYGLVLVKPGKTGPQLLAHSPRYPCLVLAESSASASTSSLPFCGTLTGKLENGHMHVEGRSITMRQIADYLPSMETLDRPVVDRTQLVGTYDLNLEWAPNNMTMEMNGVSLRPDDNGPESCRRAKRRTRAQVGTCGGSRRLFDRGSRRGALGELVARSLLL
jgi:uncharacterized protein (TIGR03435 family)